MSLLAVCGKDLLEKSWLHGIPVILVTQLQKTTLYFPLYLMAQNYTSIYTVYYFCASRNKREQTSLPLISLTCCIPFNKIIKYWQNSSLLVVFFSASQIQPLSNLFRKIAEEQRHLYSLVSGSVCAFWKTGFHLHIMFLFLSLSGSLPVWMLNVCAPLVRSCHYVSFFSSWASEVKQTLKVSGGIHPPQVIWVPSFVEESRPL